MTHTTSTRPYRMFRTLRAVSLATLALACSEADDISSIVAEPDPEAAPSLPPEADDAPAVDEAPLAPPELEQAEIDAMADSVEVFLANMPFLEVPPVNEAIFVSMSDGVRLAANLWFPDAEPRDAASLPTIYVDEWYGRGDEALGHPIQLWLEAGFAVAIVDARGYGASFGSQPAFMSKRASADQVEVLRWLASQPWSNGQVAVVGLSLSGALAGVMTGSGSADLRAAVIRAADFDQYANNLFPGGVPNENMIGGFAGLTHEMRGLACIDDLAACSLLGVQPVAADTDFSLLQAAFRDHAGNADGDDLFEAIHHDDAIGGGRWTDMLPREHANVRVPERVRASWVDGLTADSALLRFASHPNTPMQVIIGTETHSGGLDGDPFARTPFGPAQPDAHETYGDDIGFLKSVLSGEPIARSIRYRVMGTDTWRTSDAWPPSGTELRDLALSPSALTAKPAPAESEIEYRVDPATSSGRHNRWASQRGAPIHYGDRRRAPGTFLSFDAPPAEGDVELAGAPELCLVMSTDQPDGVVIAYLQDVGPDGRVTYLTEGELRLMHRATRGEPCDPSVGADRSFERGDATPVVPGERMRLEIPLANIAARIPRGHHLRLSLAGADAGTLPMLTDVPAAWRVLVGGRNGSLLRVPTRPDVDAVRAGGTAIDAD
jgi:uncharacterized protein